MAQIMARKKQKQSQPKTQDLYRYRGQLGLPTPERASHMPDGFETTQLAAGHDREGGVVQSRAQTILTHPALLSELYNASIKAYQDRGEALPAHIEIAQKPADRATAQHRGVLWSYLSTHIEVMRGNCKIVNYEGTQGGSSHDRLPLPIQQFTGKAWDRRRFYAWIREQTGMAYLTNFLDRVAEHDNPACLEDASAILTKHDLGRHLLDKEICCAHCGRSYGVRAPRSGFCHGCGARIAGRDRDAENAFYGALSFAAHVLGEAARDFVTWENRRRMVAA